jgi:hypothetical protein
LLVPFGAVTIGKALFRGGVVFRFVILDILATDTSIQVA